MKTARFKKNSNINTGHSLEVDYFDKVHLWVNSLKVHMLRDSKVEKIC